VTVATLLLAGDASLEVGAVRLRRVALAWCSIFACDLRRFALVRSALAARVFNPGNATTLAACRGQLRKSVLRGLLFDVIDHQHGHGALMHLQFQAELFFNSAEE
jgi:hypothetical protein